MYVEISSVWGSLAGILGVLPFVLWIDVSEKPDTAESRIDYAVSTAAAAIKKEIVRLAKELFGDDFPETDYAMYHGDRPAIIKAAGLKLYLRFDFDAINVTVPSPFRITTYDGKQFIIILLPHGVYLVEEISVKLPGREHGECLPGLSKSLKLNAAMYCALGKNIVSEIKQIAKNRKLRKETGLAQTPAPQNTA